MTARARISGPVVSRIENGPGRVTAATRASYRTCGFTAGRSASGCR